MKRISYGLLALVATLLWAVPLESQAFFGFFGGGFGFGFGSGWHGWGPGYWYRPWYYGGYPYWRYPYRWRRYRWGYPYRYPVLYLPPVVTQPLVVAPETPKEK